MKPITYWLQNDAVNQLVDDCGAQLERMTTESRRNLIVYLAEDAPIHNWSGVDYSEPDQAWRLVEALTRHEKDLLIEAIAATLVHHGNPWLENARATVAIAQKEGTSSH
jgi:hypothetical protein